MRVAQGVGADRQAVLVVEEPEGRLLTRSEEVRFVGDAAQPGYEVLGRVPFPVITEEPYTITLPPYGFLWFDLAPEDRMAPE